MEGLSLRVIRARFSFMARETIRFPALAANSLRGAVGTSLPPELFRPPAPEAGPSGLQTPPPPFVLRAANLNHRRFDRGQRFEVTSSIFVTEPHVLRQLALAFGVLKESGIGPTRGRAALEDVQTEELEFDLSPGPPCGRVELRFNSPTELKGHPSLTVVPPFGVVMARVRDRVSTLRALYQGGAAQADFAGMGKRALEVRLVEGEVAPLEAERKSSRTQERHPLNGFVGHAIYEGELSEFLPWLKAAEATGVGRHTVWGFGEVNVTAL